MRNQAAFHTFGVQAVVFVAVLPCWVCAAQPSCSVQEERKLHTTTAHFSVGSTNVSLTMPMKIRVLGADVVRQPGSGSPWPQAELLISTLARTRSACFVAEPIGRIPTMTMEGRSGWRMREMDS